MALLKDKHLVQNDPWTYVADADPIPATGDVIVGYARYDREENDLTQRAGRFGLRIDPEDDLVQLVTHLPKVAILAISFPKFGDGRGYTKARLLRERYHYKGELRAVGEVLADQLFYMMRCGFDSFELSPGKNVDDALKSLETFSVTYQAATDDPRPLYRRVAR